jgi:hypothetical protein
MTSSWRRCGRSWSRTPKVREILLATGDLALLPDHTPEAGAPAEWLYFHIWMELRKELQSK